MFTNKKIMPVYNGVSQVINCVKSMLGLNEGQEVKLDAKLQISIGYNASEFSSSTDWGIKGENLHCILTPARLPQNHTFITLQAGMDFYPDEEGLWQMKRDKKAAKVVMPDGIIHDFANKEFLEIEIPIENDKVLLSDCRIELEETGACRIYKLITDENTQFGTYYSDREFKLSWC